MVNKIIKFICDAMLGRTARFLRLFGYDTLYNTTYSDPELLQIAANENRVLLTRDFELHQKAMKSGIQSILLPEKTLINRFISISLKMNLNLELDSSISRCASCNVKIRPITKELVKDKVPLKTYAQFDEYWI